MSEDRTASVTGTAATTKAPEAAADGARASGPGGSGRGVTGEGAAATVQTPAGAPDPAGVAGSTGERRETQDQVTVRLPAEGAYLSVLRTATAGLAARLDFTLDEIEDLRIAVDEACAMLLSQAIPGTNLECDFELSADLMTITVAVVAAQPRTPARDTFAWTVLSALAGDVDSRLGPGDLLTIVLRKTREPSGSV